MRMDLFSSADPDALPTLPPILPPPPSPSGLKISTWTLRNVLRTLITRVWIGGLFLPPGELGMDLFEIGYLVTLLDAYQFYHAGWEFPVFFLCRGVCIRRFFHV